jgi:hypothetical protein
MGDNGPQVPRYGSWFGRSVGTNNPNELVSKVRKVCNGVVNPLRQSCGIQWFLCTGDNAIVLLTLPVKRSKIEMIVGEHGTVVVRSITENL